MNTNRLRQATLTVLVTGTLLLTSGCLKTIYMASADGYVNTKVTGTGQPFTVTIPNRFYVLGAYPEVNVIVVDRAVSWALFLASWFLVAKLSCQYATSTR